MWIALCCKLCWIKYCRYTARNDFNLSGECLFEVLFTEMLCFHWNAGLVLVVRWKAIAVRFGWIFELHDSVNNFVTFRIEAGSQQGRWQHGHIRWVADVSPLVSRRKKKERPNIFTYSRRRKIGLFTDMQLNLWLQAIFKILWHEVEENCIWWLISNVCKLWILISLFIMGDIQCSSSSYKDQGLLSTNIGIPLIKLKYMEQTSVQLNQFSQSCKWHWGLQGLWKVCSQIFLRKHFSSNQIPYLLVTYHKKLLKEFWGNDITWVKMTLWFLQRQPLKKDLPDSISGYASQMWGWNLISRSRINQRCQVK